MPTAKKAIKKKKTPDPITWKKGLVKHKKTLAKEDAAIPIRPKWGRKRIERIIGGLMTAHYVLSSGAVMAYLKANPFMTGSVDEARKALADARTVFYQAKAAFDLDDEWTEDDLEEEDEDDDTGF